MGELGLAANRLDVNSKAMILRGNLDSPRPQIQNGMIGPVMAEDEFVGPATKGQTQYLMAQADAKDRALAEQLSHSCAGVGQRGRVARSVGKKNCIGILREDLLGRADGRHYAHAETCRD